MVDYVALISACEVRVRDARRIADGCRGDAKLHQLAMKAVFVLEDTLYALMAAAGDPSTRDPDTGPGTGKT